MNTKRELRREYISKRKEMPAPVKAASEKKICTLFESLISYRYADIVMLYYPLKYELDVLPIADEALKLGKTVAFPRCNDSHDMDFRIVTNLENDFEDGMYKIREPKTDRPILDIKNDGRSKICVIPAIVYDKNGYRLGYGKGYYDRYLSAFSGMKVGFCYSSFIIDRIPRGRFDLAVDVLITEKGVRNLSAN